MTWGVVDASPLHNVPKHTLVMVSCCGDPAPQEDKTDPSMCKISARPKWKEKIFKWYSVVFLWVCHSTLSGSHWIKPLIQMISTSGRNFVCTSYKGFLYACSPAEQSQWGRGRLRDCAYLHPIEFSGVCFWTRHVLIRGITPMWHSDVPALGTAKGAGHAGEESGMEMGSPICSCRNNAPKWRDSRRGESLCFIKVLPQALSGGIDPPANLNGASQFKNIETLNKMSLQNNSWSNHELWV